MRSVVVNNIPEKKSNKFIKVLAIVSKLFGSVAVAISSYSFLAPIAAAERGYTGAIGGEGILVILAFCGTYKLFNYVFENLKG